MKWVLFGVGGLILLVGIMALIGAMLPKAHHATRKARFRVSPDALFAVLMGPPDWRTGVKSFGVLPEVEGRKRWWEQDSHGQKITYELAESQPPRRLVTRMADKGLPFGGAWTFDIAPLPDGGSELRIHEDGEIYNVFFRFMARAFFGYTSSIETYMQDLGAKFGQTVALKVSMGQELECRVRYADRKLRGKAQLETDYVLFRGEERLEVLFQDLKGVHAADGVLRLEFEGGPAEFEIGAAAEKWAHKILHPPSLLDKLGVKPDSAVHLVGDLEAGFQKELAAAGCRRATANVDLVFAEAATAADLKRLPEWAGALQPAGALWVVYPKGVDTIREKDVLEAGRAAGLKDVKVARFSATHTALKFVFPLSAR